MKIKTTIRQKFNSNSVFINTITNEIQKTVWFYYGIVNFKRQVDNTLITIPTEERKGCYVISIHKKSHLFQGGLKYILKVADYSFSKLVIV